MSHEQKVMLFESILTEGIIPVISEHSLKYPFLNEWIEANNLTGVV